MAAGGTQRLVIQDRRRSKPCHARPLALAHAATRIPGASEADSVGPVTPPTCETAERKPRRLLRHHLPLSFLPRWSPPRACLTRPRGPRPGQSASGPSAVNSSRRSDGASGTVRGSVAGRPRRGSYRRCKPSGDDRSGASTISLDRYLITVIPYERYDSP